MELITALVVLLTAVVLYHMPQLIEYWTFLKKVEKLPTSKYYPLLRHGWDMLGPSNQRVKRFKDLVERSPSPFIFWLGPVPTLFLSKARHIEMVLGSIKFIEKPFFYKFLEPWLGTGLLTSKGAKWHTHRKMITPTFHFKILESFVEIFAEKSSILVDKLQEKVGLKDFDIYPYITKCALDIICESSMGVDVNSQLEDEESEYVKAVLNISDDVMNRMLSPWLYPDFLYNISPSGIRLMKDVKVLHNFSNKVIAERKQQFNQSKLPEATYEDNSFGTKKKMAFLDLLLEIADKDNALTDEEIREEVDTFMFEGHDTTTAGISWAIQMLASHPDVQEKVYEEQQNIFFESDRPPTMKDLNEMKYLERVIKEALRLYPSVPCFTRELKEDIEIDGLTYPAGMKILFLPYNSHRDSDNFSDPDRFNPDNFLPENIIKRHPYAYIPFSAGPRNCIGQKYAILEEKMMISYIIRNFKLQATTEVPVAIPMLILRPENGIHVKITPRKTNESDRNTRNQNGTMHSN